MKQCPACHRTYSDDSITFCLADGSLLSAPYGADATQRIPARITSPPPTEVLTNDAPPTLVLPQHMSPTYPVRRNNRATLYVVIALVVLLVVGGIIVLVKVNQSSQSANSNVTSSNTSAKPVASKSASDYLRSPWLG